MLEASIGIHVGVDQWCDPSPVGGVESGLPGRLGQILLNHQGVHVDERKLDQVQLEHGVFDYNPHHVRPARPDIESGPVRTHPARSNGTEAPLSLISQLHSSQSGRTPDTHPPAKGGAPIAVPVRASTP